MNFSNFTFTFLISAISVLVSYGSSQRSVRQGIDLKRILEDYYYDCNEHEIDFIMLEGDELKTSVEDEIVAMLEVVGITVNTRKLSRDEYNAAEQAGDFHLSFSESWGSPYDPHAYAKGWVASDEGHNQALTNLEAPDSRESLFALIEDVLQEEDHVARITKWETIHKVVHDNAVMLPLWGNKIPTVLNSKRLANFRPGYQQFDYPVHNLEVLQGSNDVTIAPGTQSGLFNSVGRMDPHTYRPNEPFSNNWVYEGLVSYGFDGRILPSLAESWTINDTGDGGQSYTFTLRSYVTFHDGEAWDCAAAKLNMDHVLAPPLRTADWHGWYGLMFQVDSWECTGDMELVVKTKGKYYPFLQELSFIRPLRMLSPAAFAGDADPLTSNSCHVGWGTITNDGVTVICAGITNISGTGPFMFGSRTLVDESDQYYGDSEVVFNRNPNYWGGAPSIENLIVQRYESSEEIKAALLDGSLDLVWGSGPLNPQDLVSLDEDLENDISVFYSDDINNQIILLNTGKPPLDDIAVRKTIIHAIDKKTIIDNELYGIVEMVDEVYPQDAPYCDVELTPRWDYDLEKAQSLNCPVETETVVVEEYNSLTDLGLGLVLVLGLTFFVFLVLTISLVR